MASLSQQCSLPRRAGRTRGKNHYFWCLGRWEEGGWMRRCMTDNRVLYSCCDAAASERSRFKLYRRERASQYKMRRFSIEDVLDAVKDDGTTLEYVLHGATTNV